MIDTRTEQNQTSRECSHHCRIPALLHDSVHQWNGQTAHHGWKCSHTDVGHSRFRIAVANILEFELTIESNEPASEAEEKLREGRVYVEIVFS